MLRFFKVEVFHVAHKINLSVRDASCVPLEILIFREFSLVTVTPLIQFLTLLRFILLK